MKDVEFVEDKKFFSPLKKKDEKIPEKGFEGWFYKNVPGKYSAKRVALIVIVISLFVLSAVFLMLGRFTRYGL